MRCTRARAWRSTARQGIGRSGMIAAAALISGGQDAETVINTLRRSRGLEGPETHAQRQWILAFLSWLAVPHKEREPRNEERRSIVFKADGQRALAPDTGDRSRVPLRVVDRRLK